MALIDEMRNLREDIESGKEVRSRRLKEISQDLAVFMKGASRKRKEDFKVLTEEVKKFITDLKKDVKTSLKENRAKQKELKKMLAQAQAAFWRKKSKPSTKKGGES